MCVCARGGGGGITEAAFCSTNVPGKKETI